MPKTHIENLYNEEGGIVNIHESPHIIPKALTTQTGLANDIDFVGRKEELQKVDELLNQNATLLLLNGIGGIGKSTLVSYYLNQKKDEFDYYGFVQVNDNIKLSLASAFSTSLDLKSEKIDDLFAEIMNKLQNLEGKKLLIIDDVKEMDNQLDEMNTLMTLKNSGFQILFTSREVKEYIPQYFLDIMSVEDARELFLKHYPTDEMDKVDKILEYLDYHTLFIEITAKTLTKRKRTLSLDKMIEKFDNGEFSSIKKNKNESFNLFLNDLFADDKILQAEETLLFLKRLSVLPSIEISFEDLYKFLVCEDEERLEEFLIELVDNGWLIESEHTYKFHQILKEFIFDNYLPEFFNDIEKILNYSLILLENSENSQTAVDNKKNLIFFDTLLWSLEKIVKEDKVNNYILNNMDNIMISNFANHVGNIYDFLGQYKIAKKLYLKSLRINKRVFGVNHFKTSTVYNNLGKVYESLRMYEKAEIFLLKSLKIKESISGKEDTDKAISYNNLASLYASMKIYEKAENLYLKALNINQTFYGKEHHSIATNYNNLASLYDSMEMNEKAEFFYLKALKIRETVLKNQHPEIADIYSNLGIFYFKIKKFEYSYKYIKKSIIIYDRFFSHEHPVLLNSIKLLEKVEINKNI